MSDQPHSPLEKMQDDLESLRRRLGVAEGTLCAERKRMQDEKEEFLSRLVHDLRNPLFPILNAVELLRLPETNDLQRQRAIDIIDGQARELRRVLDDLDAARNARGDAAETQILAPDELHSQPSRRILIVSDSEESAEEWSLLLRVAGHDVRSASNAGAALALAQSFQPHAISLEIGLAVFDGDDLARRLREKTGLEKVAVVAIFDDASKDCRRRAADAGCDAVLGKPVKIRDFLQLIAK